MLAAHELKEIKMPVEKDETSSSFLARFPTSAELKERCHQYDGAPSTDTTQWLAAPGYQCLADVLKRAHDQAAYGKGAERHANGKPFDSQPIRDLIRLHGVGFATGQASKKASEALGLPTVERQVAEMLGSIVYLVGAINALEAGDK